MAGAVFMAGAVQLFTADSAIAQQTPTCAVSDFVTGGGFIIIPDPKTGAHANFGVAGGCKDGSFWGHLEYVDHGSGLDPSAPTPFNVHWMSITAYRFTDATTREICGTARTNDNDHSMVGFHVTVQDNDGLGIPDTFRIQLIVNSTPSTPPFFYDTSPNTLSGGNIEIHKPNSSTPTFDGDCPIFLQ